MSDEKKADYVVNAEGDVRQNDRVRPLVDKIHEMDKARDLIDAAWCGARIAGLFKKHDWLESFTLNLDACSEGDDHGGFYRSVSLHVRDPKHRDGKQAPQEVMESGMFDEDSAADLLEQELQDDEHSIYAAFVDDGEYVDLSMEVQRREISDLLGEPQVSGREAFKRLFPEYDSLITSIGDRF